MNAKRVLVAEAVLVGGMALALLIWEVPGLVREVRILRMVGFRSGSRHPR
ncbi:hypothetical protein AB0D27_05475 [Streptomyces sp. NPDC048415]|jgi:hypothetical protein